MQDPLRAATLEMASNHLICSVALTGVLVLQAARYWAESADDDGIEELADGTKSRARTPAPEGPPTSTTVPTTTTGTTKQKKKKKAS
jgi:hypothetical protein